MHQKPKMHQKRNWAPYHFLIKKTKINKKSKINKKIKKNQKLTKHQNLIKNQKIYIKNQKN